MSARVIYQPICESVIVAAVAFSTILCFFPPEGLWFKWWEDHTFLILLSTLGLGLLCLGLNYKRGMIVCFGACAALCLLLQDRTQTPLRNADPTDDAVISIAQFSLPSIDGYFDKNLQTILDINADIVSIQAIKLPELQKTHDLFTCCGYPYYECVVDSARKTAIAMYARHPTEFATKTEMTEVPGILGKMKLPMGETTQNLYFFSTFLLPAATPAAYNATREQLHTFAYDLNHLKAPLIACGDYNLVPWSKDIQVFKTFAQVQDSRRALLPSAPHGYFSPLDYAFDHIFYSDHFECLNFETISTASTPHLGILGTYQFKPYEPDNNARKASQEF